MLQQRAVTAPRQVKAPRPVMTTQNRPYLSDLDPRQRRREERRAAGDRIAQKLQEEGGELHQGIGKQMSLCSTVLEMGWRQDQSGQARLQQQWRWRCRGRHCPECQWVRTFLLQQRLNTALPELQDAYPTAGFVSLDLTVKNCLVEELHTTLLHMSQAWQRLIQRVCWPALGWMRTVEVTRGVGRSAHPHYHCILLVPAAYFGGRSYLSHKQWAALWQECLRADYQPIVYVRRITPEKLTSTLSPHADGNDAQETSTRTDQTRKRQARALTAAVRKAVGYVTKASQSPPNPADAGASLPKEADDDWFLVFVAQLYKTRAFAAGGELKDVLKDATKRMQQDVAQKREARRGGLRFEWQQQGQRYKRVSSVSLSLSRVIGGDAARQPRPRHPLPQQT
jgi:plasmid rolling circle replication initiator protein Rep